MTRSKWQVTLAVFAVLVTGAMWADSWIPPSTKDYVSPDGEWRLTVTPRDITSPLAYFEDKVAERPNAGRIPGSAQTSAIGQMEHLRNGQWQTVWKEPLVNEVSPVDALASNSGQAVTFDNWHSMGYGKDAIAIYDAKGGLVRAFGLMDFLPKEYIHALPRTVSSMYWRGEPRISEDGHQLIIPVVIPEAGQEGFPTKEKTTYIDISFDLASGLRLEGDSLAWSAALASAHRAHLQLEEQEAAAGQRFISPLAAPSTDEIGDWHRYLIDAFFRLDPDSEDRYPATKVIPLATADKFELLSGYLGDAMTDDLHEHGTIMIASPSQDVLVDVLTEQAKRAKAGSHATTRIYVAVDDQHVDAARKALALTGAEFIQIDINQEIPQRKERLDRYLKNLDEAESD